MAIYLPKTYAESIAQLKSWTREDLEAALLNEYYNSFLRRIDEIDDSEVDVHGHGKRVPYIGWYWRDLNFYNKRLPIAVAPDSALEGRGFCGFIAKNKWGYPQRNTTDDEFGKIIDIIDRAMNASNQSGDERRLIETELWAYLQSLRDTINREAA